jgi:hypothetical protein
MPERDHRSRLGALISVLVAVTAVATCSAPRQPLESPASPSPSPVVADPSDRASGTVAAGPPVAAVAAQGGDPTDGQLGTYTWGDGGSDAPWLPGARIAVGAGEPLTVTFRPETTIGRWSARTVPASADGPAGATILAHGSGRPQFIAPGGGTWTVEVRVVFANAAGEASYFWQLAVD